MGRDYEIIGWVLMSKDGALKTKNVDVKLSDDKKGFFYNNKKYPPGLYYLIRRKGRVGLISDEFLSSVSSYD